METEPTYQTLREEFQQVVARHNDLLSETPAYSVSQLYMLADAIRRRHNIEVDDVEEQENGTYLILLDDEEMAAVINIDDPAQAQDLDVHQIDDRLPSEGPA